MAVIVLGVPGLVSLVAMPSLGALLILAGLVNIPGFCVCVIGALFTAPLGLAAVCYAYEDIFGRQNA